MEWARHRLHLQDIELVVDDQLRAPHAADRNERVIWLHPGLDDRAAVHAMTDCVLYIVGGRRWAPEFRQPSRPDRRILSSGAVLLDFPDPLARARRAARRADERRAGGGRCICGRG